MMRDAMHNAVIYIRISKDRDNQTSTATQLRECLAYCEKHNLNVIEVCEDKGKSAFDQTVKRPGFIKAMQHIEGGTAQTLVVWKLDRLIRSAKEFKRIWLRIDDANGELVSATETYVNTSDPLIREILLAVMSIMAELESRTKSERIQPWHDERRKQGIIPNGPVPFGYRKVMRNVVDQESGQTFKRAHYVPVANHAKMIQAAAMDIVENGTSIRAIARKWNESGITSSQGKHWSHHGVKAVLTNPTTAGFRIMDGELFQGTWEAILDTDTWQAVCAHLSDPERTTTQPHQRERKWLLSSLVKCGRDGCDGTLRAKPHAQGPRYACRKCGLSMDAGIMDGFVESMTLELLDADAWADMKARGQAADGEAIKALEARLAAARERWLDGRIDDDEWDAVRDSVKERIANLSGTDAVELPDVDDVRQAWPSMSLDGKRLVLMAAWQTMRLDAIGPGCSGTQRIKLS